MLVPLGLHFLIFTWFRAQICGLGGKLMVEVAPSQPQAIFDVPPHVFPTICTNFTHQVFFQLHVLEASAKFYDCNLSD